MPTLAVWAYESADRAAVRSIAYETGFMGESIGWLWSDRESFADLITNYYLNRKPASAYVATKNGVVVGYLLGCKDSKNAKGTTKREILKIVARGGMVKLGVARFLWRSIGDLIRDRGAANAEFVDSRWPSDFHINLLPQGRGLGLGRQLMDAWLKKLRDSGVPGVHLATFIENTNAHGFFAHYGFEDFGQPVPVPGFRTRDGRRMHVQWMVRAI